MRKFATAQKLDWLEDFTILTSGTSQLRTVALVNGSAQGAVWAAAHRPELVRFLRVFRAAVAYGYDHPAVAVAIMSRKLKMDPADAQTSYDEVFGRNGISRDLVIDLKALQNVVDIGTLPAAPPLAAIIDPSFVREARSTK